MNFMTGILITFLYANGMIIPAEPPFDVVQKGGLFEAHVTLQYNTPTLYDASFIVIENMPDCIKATNIKLEPEQGFVIKDFKENENRRWELKPLNQNFKKVEAQITIDFINQCSVS